MEADEVEGNHSDSSGDLEEDQDLSSVKDGLATAADGLIDENNEIEDNAEQRDRHDYPDESQDCILTTDEVEEEDEEEE